MSFHPLLKKCWRPKKRFRNDNWDGNTELTGTCCTQPRPGYVTGN